LPSFAQPQPWLVDLKVLTEALREIYGPSFRLGDRDLVMQLAADARAEDQCHLADTLADYIRFPGLGQVERMSAIHTLSRSLGHGRKSGFNRRVSYNVSLPPRLSLAFNPYHLPAGASNSTGGQFTNREGAITVAFTNRQREENLQRIKEAVDRRRDLPATVRNAVIEIFDVEGRGAIDAESGAAAGITNEKFAEARTKVPGLEHVRQVADLTSDQIVSVYKYVLERAFHRHGGVSRLDAFTDRRTAIAMADTVFAHGQNGGATMLRRAAETVLKRLAPVERSRAGLSATIGGPVDTFDTLLALSNRGYAQEVRTAIADQRRAWVRQQEDEIRRRKLPAGEERRELRNWTGWRPRIRRFE
jgi:hypothetical protein